jgi:hypothetical protein
MPKKKPTKELPKLPARKKSFELESIIDPDEAIIPEEFPDIIPEENPYENPEPYEIPEPGEGP